MWTCLRLVALVVILLLVTWRFDPFSRWERRYKAALAAREPTSDDELVSRYFAEEKIPSNVPGHVRRTIAKHTGYPAEKIHPDDDFTPFWAQLDMADLVTELEADFGITFTDAEAERTRCTVRAVSMLIAEKLDRKTGTSVG